MIIDSVKICSCVFNYPSSGYYKSSGIINSNGLFCEIFSQVALSPQDNIPFADLTRKLTGVYTATFSYPVYDYTPKVDAPQILGISKPKPINYSAGRSLVF